MRLDPEAYETRARVELASGAVLEPLVVEVTRAMVVMSAAATWTFFGGHTDTAYAQMQGRREIYLATGAVNGLLDRYVTLRSGPEAFVRLRKVAMRESICAGDTVTFSGRVDGMTSAPVGRAVPGPVRVLELAIEVTNEQDASCVQATVVVELPAGG
jgi:hypothetical protein